MVRKLLALVLKAILIILFIKITTENRYINRHKDKEDWNLSGIKTAGFYANNILWNKKDNSRISG